jgi:hypothetical protein
VARPRSWSDDDLRAAVADARSWKEVRDRLGLRGGGTTYRSIRARAAAIDLAVDHLPEVGASPRRFTDEDLTAAVAGATSLHGVFRDARSRRGRERLASHAGAHLATRTRYQSLAQGHRAPRTTRDPVGTITCRPGGARASRGGGQSVPRGSDASVRSRPIQRLSAPSLRPPTCGAGHRPRPPGRAGVGQGCASIGPRTPTTRGDPGPRLALPGRELQTPSALGRGGAARGSLCPLRADALAGTACAPPARPHQRRSQRQPAGESPPALCQLRRPDRHLLRSEHRATALQWRRRARPRRAGVSLRRLAPVLESGIQGRLKTVFP